MAVTPSPATTTTRRTVLYVESYDAAERAVDSLSDQDFPVEHVAIVGTGLRYIEQIGGRVTTGSAALMGMAEGAVLGLLWGLFFGLFFTVDSGSFLGVVAYSAIMGGVFGVILGAVVHAAKGGRRDFDASSQTIADRYEVQVDDAFATEAERLLTRKPAS
jgi:hypothetical protein